ncbi:hypothetical protein CGRA01v4_05652 [Colletotrichum graminicola]|nr:hypothetical protein CGRA01v4_05652 [Colletotrichum graminicola]
MWVSNNGFLYFYCRGSQHWMLAALVNVLPTLSTAAMHASVPRKVQNHLRRR